MSKYVVGDIHGNLEAWETMKELIRPNKNDRIIFVGDIIDRGSNGVKILQEIIADNRMHLILGNHELMMLNNWNIDKYSKSDAEIIKENWMDNGGYPTLQAMSELSADDQNKIIEYISHKSRLKSKIKTADGRVFSVCHGWINGDPEHDENIHSVVWDRPERIDNPNLPLGETLIVGHTPVINLLTNAELKDIYSSHCRILHAPHYINIDCGCGHKDDRCCLACLRLDDMAEYYV